MFLLVIFDLECVTSSATTEVVYTSTTGSFAAVWSIGRTNNFLGGSGNTESKSKDSPFWNAEIIGQSFNVLFLGHWPITTEMSRYARGMCVYQISPFRLFAPRSPSTTKTNPYTRTKIFAGILFDSHHIEINLSSYRKSL